MLFYSFIHSFILSLAMYVMISFSYVRSRYDFPSGYNYAIYNVRQYNVMKLVFDIICHGMPLFNDTLLDGPLCNTGDVILQNIHISSCIN